MNLRNNLIILAAALCTMSGCASSATKKAGSVQPQEKQAVVPSIQFNADSAYAYVAAQCAFGERVPNTEAHRKCGDYLAGELRRRGAKVTEQNADLKAFDGTVLKARNIIGEFYPEKPNRILLLAHWDCRPWADHDPNPDNRKKPVMGANDGASGVGVLLEIARLLQQHEPQAGIDILFTDAEDWGASDGSEESWALGTQHWVSTPHRSGYTYPSFGILLDMVGDKNAVFAREYFSQAYAGSIVDKVWETAASLGYSDRFVNREGGAMTDDHVFVIKAGIPLDQVSVQIQEGEKRILVSVPAAQILSYQIDTDSVEVLDEQNSLFNSISVDDKIQLDVATEQAMKDRAIESGLLEKAQQNAQDLLTRLICSYPQVRDKYTISFTQLS